MEPLEGSNRYKKIKDVNKGSFGFVQLAEELSTGKQFAIKFIERGEKVTKYVEREILNHRCLIHPHVVQFHEVFLTPMHLGTAMEYVGGGDMFEYIHKRGGLPESSARWFFQQLIIAVDYLHKMEIANRDIKLENVLLDTSPRPLLKLCDFGYSKHEKFHSAPTSGVGTPAYLAPEVIRARGGVTYDGKISDIWSCGVMLYVMLVGAYPFERPKDEGPSKMQKMIQRILRVEYSIPEKVKLSSDVRDLLGRILDPDPERRITIPEIQRHPWYRKNLPEGVVDMNDDLPVPGDDAQPLWLVTKIVKEAQVPLSPMPGGWDNSGYVEELIDQDMAEYDSTYGLDTAI